MKKSVLNLGVALNKVEQQSVNGSYMHATCEELGWNEHSCANVSPEDQLDKNYYRCC